MPDPADAVTMTITPRISSVLLLADQISRRHGQDFVGTEHLLLALIQDGDGIAGQVLTALRADVAARKRIEAILQSEGYRGGVASSAPLPSPLRLTVPRAQPLISPPAERRDL